MTSSSDPLNTLPLPLEDRIELEGFCRQDADRYEIIRSSMKRRGIPSETIPIAGGRHIVVPVPGAGILDDEYYRVTLVAHYDRVENTPGANDNAAAVFQLLAHWEDINRLGWHHRTQFLFTDREELTGNMEAAEQGSWHLGRHLKRLKVNNVLFFVLDMTGIGNTPVWGRSVRKVGILPGHHAHSHSLNTMEGFLRKFTGGRDFGVNPMFSDDLGLLMAGYPALQLSLLPAAEADKLLSEHEGHPVEADPSAPARARERIRSSLPESWKVNHSPDDGPETLDPAAFNLMARLLRNLARFRFPLP